MRGPASSAWYTQLTQLNLALSRRCSTSACRLLASELFSVEEDMAGWLVADEPPESQLHGRGEVVRHARRQERASVGAGRDSLPPSRRGLRGAARGAAAAAVAGGNLQGQPCACSTTLLLYIPPFNSHCLPGQCSGGKCSLRGGDVRGALGSGGGALLGLHGIGDMIRPVYRNQLSPAPSSRTVSGAGGCQPPNTYCNTHGSPLGGSATPLLAYRAGKHADEASGRPFRLSGSAAAVLLCLRLGQAGPGSAG